MCKYVQLNIKVQKHGIACNYQIWPKFYNYLIKHITDKQT